MSEENEPEVTGTVDMRRAFVATPGEDLPAARLFAEVLRQASPLAPVQLSIERSGSETSDWVVVRLSGSKPPETQVLFSMPSTLVRGLLAYVAFAAMRGQPYGGYMHRLVEIDARKFRGIFYLSNDGFAGYWLRLYLFPFETSDGA